MLCIDIARTQRLTDMLHRLAPLVCQLTQQTVAMLAGLGGIVVHGELNAAGYVGLAMWQANVRACMLHHTLPEHLRCMAQIPAVR